MKQKLIRFIAMLIAIFLPHIFITALGNKDWMPECEKALKAHPEFVEIEEYWGDEYGTHIKIDLFNGKSLTFEGIDMRSGGGKNAGLSTINEFTLGGYAKVRKDESTPWKNCYGMYASFEALQTLLDVKIETMLDCIDNYDKIFELVQTIAQDQYFSEDRTKGRFGFLTDDNPETLDLYKKFPHNFVITKNRRLSVFVLYIYDYQSNLWEYGIQESDLERADYYKMRYGENWREKLNADLPKIRESLGLE